MQSYLLYLCFKQKYYPISLDSTMSSNHIKCKSAEFFGINIDDFEIRVRDECSNNYFTLTDEDLRKLFEQYPRTTHKMLFGTIVPVPTSSKFYSLQYSYQFV